MDFVLTLDNGKQLQAAFRKVPLVAYREYNLSLERIAAHITAESQKLAPVGKYKGGGNLRQSIRYRPYGPAAYIVSVNANYGRYVEFGTKPHVIVPKTKKTLAWKTDSGWRFAKRVNHPGTKAQPFFGPAVESGSRYASKELGKAMDRVLSTL